MLHAHHHPHILCLGAAYMYQFAPQKNLNAADICFCSIKSKINVIDNLRKKKYPANLFLLMSKADQLLSYELGYFKRYTLLSITLNEISVLYLYKITRCYFIEDLHHSKSMPVVLACTTALCLLTHNTYMHSSQIHR